MRNNTPSNPPIIRITHFPSISNGSYERILPTGTIRRTEHAQIVPVALNRALPRNTLHSGAIVQIRIQSIAVAVEGAIPMKDCDIAIRDVGEAGWTRRAKKSEVPLFIQEFE